MHAECTCWTYHHGEDDWSGCEEGKNETHQQSPINITSCAEATEPLQLNLGSSVTGVTVANTGTTAQYQVESPSEDNNLGSFYDGEMTHFVRFLRFHSPAEHQVNGKIYDMELELVAYSSIDPCPCCPPTGVLSFFWKRGVTSDFLSHLQWKSELFRTLLLPPGCNELVHRSIPQIDLHWINQLAKPSYYRYTGSLTTPPCTTPVERFLMCRPQQLSFHQLSLFRNLLRHMPRTKRSNTAHANNRTIQPLRPHTAVKCYYS